MHDWVGRASNSIWTAEKVRTWAHGLEARNKIKGVQDLEMEDDKRKPLQYYDIVRMKYFDKRIDRYKYLYEGAG